MSVHLVWAGRGGGSVNTPEQLLAWCVSVIAILKTCFNLLQAPGGASIVSSHTWLPPPVRPGSSPYAFLQPACRWGWFPARLATPAAGSWPALVRAQHLHTHTSPLGPFVCCSLTPLPPPLSPPATPLGMAYRRRWFTARPATPAAGPGAPLVCAQHPHTSGV